MKRLFTRCLLFLALASIANAADDAPISSYFPQAEIICLSRVESQQKDMVTFSVTENLRGKAPDVLILKADGVPYTFPKNSEWLLVSYAPEHHGRYKDTVGWQPEGGFDGWFPVEVLRFTGSVFIKDWALPNSGIVLDTAPDGTKGLTLDHVKRLLQERPYKP